ncbi:helicase-related protein [Vibrio chagasii]|nr:helicase-related protein [Vibrio chagasii]
MVTRAKEERAQALDSFKNGDTRVLIATDVMARGIHIDQLPIVINFELPPHAATLCTPRWKNGEQEVLVVQLSLVSHRN